MNDPETDGLSYDPTPDELTAMVAGFRDREFARWFVLAFGVAAIQWPEEIRKAVGTVFSVEAIEQANRQQSLVLAQNQAKLAELLDAIREAQAVMSQLAEQFTHLRGRCKAMNEWLNKKSTELKERTR